MYAESEHDGRDYPSRASEADQAIIESIPIVLDSAGHKPGTGSASVASEEHPRDEDGQPKRDPLVEASLHPGDGGLQGACEWDFGMLRFLALRIGSL